MCFEFDFAIGFDSDSKGNGAGLVFFPWSSCSPCRFRQSAAFGRDLFAAEIISLIQQIPLVKYVLDVEIHQRSMIPVEEKWMYDECIPRTKRDDYVKGNIDSYTKRYKLKL